MRLWRILLFLFCLGAVVTQPVFTSHYYTWMLERGAYRWDADSIGIPISENFSVWLWWAPPLTILFWMAFWRVESIPRFLAWDAKRRVKSILVSTVCFAAIYLVGLGIPDALRWENWAEIFSCLWWIVVWFMIRSAFLTPKVPRRKKTVLTLGNSQPNRA